MSVLMLWLSESVEAKEMAGGIARAEVKETKVLTKMELLLSQLGNAQETDRSLLRECDGKVSRLLENLEEAKRVAVERERIVANLVSETARLQSALEALEAEKKELV
jgi:hypothetical protein